MVILTQVSISQEHKQINYCIRSNVIFLRHFFCYLQLAGSNVISGGRSPFISALNSYEHMPVWFNEAISDLVCQSSDAEKATEHEVRPMAV